MSDSLKDVMALIGRIESLTLSCKVRAKTRWELQVPPDVKTEIAINLTDVGDKLALVFKDLGKVI